MSANRGLDSSKVEWHMETTLDGSFFEEGDYVRVKRTKELGTVNAVAGGVVYVVMDETQENRVFATYIDDDALIELVVDQTNK